MEGWIKIHRKLQGRGFASKPHYLAVWIHLLLSAQHGSYETWLGGREIKLRPGQLVTGRKKLSVCSGVSESHVERILKWFEKKGQIEQQKFTKGRIITIVKWVDYQIQGQHRGQQEDSKRTTKGQQEDTIQECKNERMKERGEKRSRRKTSLHTAKLPDGTTVHCRSADAHLSPEAPAHLTRVKDELKPRDPEKLVWISDSQWEGLLKKFGGMTIGAQARLVDYVQRVADWAETNPEKFNAKASHAAIIRTWSRKDMEI